MITPEKNYTTNPFVDNIIYYAKLMAMNCTIKDEEEALSYETKESLYAADVLIACVEKKSKYEMFTSIPKEILEKYIAPVSNLDLFTKNTSNLRAHLNSYSKFQRTKILNNLSSLARTVYIDHFDMMALYINEAGETWLDDKRDLYDLCKLGTATYEDLFNELPIKTVLRVLKKYLNPKDYAKLENIWNEKAIITLEDVLALVPKDGGLPPSDIELRNRASYENRKELLLDTNYIVENLDYFVDHVDTTTLVKEFYDEFIDYTNNRTDTDIIEDLNKISKAMREIFIDHYDMMVKRNYFANALYYNEDTGDDEADWTRYVWNKDVFDECKNGTADYTTLYNFFPRDVLYNCLCFVLGTAQVNTYGLMDNLDILVEYFNSGYCIDAETKKQSLSDMMVDLYVKNYNMYMNTDIYARCLDERIDYFGLVEYIPRETLKCILQTEFDEVTNLQVYAGNKKMLNSYLNTLDKSEADRIKNAINIDMQSWYPENHVETNNYYRALIGLPPMDKDGYVYEDTLLRSYDEESASFVNFGNTYLNKAPTNIYPIYHWRQEFYKYDSYDISILKEYGLIDEFIEACGSDINQPRYRYLKYLGDDKLNLYECRKAQNFALIGMPTVDDEEVKSKFIDSYAVNRDIIIRTVYSDAMKFQSDYYNKFIIIFILINTIMDMLSDIPDFIINRDVFDARCIKYLFDAFGIPYYSEIPLKYQRAMLKNLNVLIKYKSSTKNMVDICSLFGFRDVKVFGYYMMKDREVDSYTGEYVFDENNAINYSDDDLYVLDPADGSIEDASSRRFSKLKDYRYFDHEYYYNKVNVVNDEGAIEEKWVLNNDRDVFVYDREYDEMIPLKDTTYFTHVKANTIPASLKFIKVPIEKELTAYKKDTDYQLDYDEVTYGDEYWDAGENHDKLKQKILDYEFNAVKSKYISIETATDMTELAFQMSYFYSMIFDNYYSEDALMVNIPYIKASHKFKFTDTLCYLFALMYYYYDLKDNIMYSPTQILYVKGYNFDEDLNTIMQDPKLFSQEDEYGPLQDYEKESIFDVNERIAEDKYDYLKEFDREDRLVKAFNLNADIDELDAWMLKNYQMSLDDFVVDDSLTDFDHIITVRSFYTMNNSYYQKGIFSGTMKPTQYNNEIKYAYDYTLEEKLYFNDVSNHPHTFIREKTESAADIGMSYGYVEGIFAIIPKENGVPSSEEIMDMAQHVSSIDDLYDDNYILSNIFSFDDETTQKIINELGYKYYIEVIEDTSRDIYIFNNNVYATDADGNPIALHNMYSKYYGNYALATNQYFILYNGYYKPLINGRIRVKNSDNLFAFGTDKVYKKLEDGTYEEITDEKYLNPVLGGKYYILNYNQDYYYLDEDGNYVLKPDKCFIKVEKAGVESFAALSTISDFNNMIVEDSDCYIRHSDGHFVQFDYTDYYRRTHNDNEEYNEAIYVEEDLFVVTTEETVFYDPSVTPRKYYKKLEDFYYDNNYKIFKDTLYVLDPNGNYIEEKYFLSPLTCYYYDYETSSYKLITKQFYEYKEYDNPKDIRYILIRQEDNDYYKYKLSEDRANYVPVPSQSKRYVYESNTNYILILNTETTYDKSKNLIVVFNRDMNKDTIDSMIADDDKYNPSLHDDVWDENDWFYKSPSHDPDNAIGKNGENIWYYLPEGESRDTDIHDDANLRDTIGSGYYIDPTEYINNTNFIEGEEYYISFDVETNFDGQMNIFCDADSGYENPSNRSYYFYKNEITHISQVFTANSKTTPSLKFLKYGFVSNPIEVGDYINISNIKVLKSYSDDFISNDIPSYDELDKIYRTNTAIYKYLVSQMINTDDFETYNIYKKLYDSLMIAKYNKEVFKLDDGTYALTFTDFLKSRDEVLHTRLKNYQNMEFEAMKTAIADEIIEITYALNDSIGKYGYEYLYSYFPGVSINFIQDYIYKIINWFKSWKVQLLGISTVYRLGGSGDTAFDNNDYIIKILQDEEYKIKLRENFHEGFVYGDCKVNPFDDVSPDGTPYTDLYDFDDSVINDKVRIRDRVRVIARTANTIAYTDNYENLHIRLNDDTTIVKVEDENILKISTINGDEFHAVNINELLMTTDETQEDMFASQIIDEINLLSGDYIDYDELEDDEDE